MIEGGTRDSKVRWTEKGKKKMLCTKSVQLDFFLLSLNASLKAFGKHCVQFKKV